MAAYDSVQFDPPAPLAYVTLRQTSTAQQWPDVPMLLDSGADVTLLPRSAVDRLGVTVIPERQYELVGFDGVASLAPVVHLELVFLGRTFRGQFLLIDQEWGIIGRNVLNAVALLASRQRLVPKLAT